MITFISTYLFIGVIISITVYYDSVNEGITGDMILSQFDDDTKRKCLDNPDLFKFGMICTFVVIIFVWPYVLYKLLTS